MSPLRIVFFILLLIVSAGPAGAAHITDKLVVGIYPQPDAGVTPIKLLSSGTPLEVLQRKDGYAEVRLADDIRGWVEARYVTEEKPANAMLLEAQTRLRALNGELQALKASGAADEGVVAPAPLQAPSAPSARDAQLRQDLATAESRIDELEQKLAQRPVAEAAQQQLQLLQAQVQKASQLLAEAQGLEMHAVEASTQEDFFSRYQALIVGLAAVLLGFGVGVAFIDYRIRKRYGGFRI